MFGADLAGEAAPWLIESVIAQKKGSHAGVGLFRQPQPLPTQIAAEFLLLRNSIENIGLIIELCRK